MAITEQDVLKVLGKVVDPDLHRDIVSLGFVKKVGIRDARVEVQIELTTPACPVRDHLREQARQLLLSLPGVKEVGVEMTANVPRFRVPEERPLVPDARNMIAVASGKGGVGKTTVAVNLAIALAKSGAKVGLLDADIYGPNTPIMLGLQGERPEVHNQKLLPIERYGVHAMSIGFLTDEDTAVIWRGPLVGRTIQQFLTDVAWGDLDYLIIDLPPGTGDAQLTLTQSVPLTGAIIVTTPQDVALADVRRGIAMFQKVNVAILGVIENMSYFVCPHCAQRTNIFSHGGGREAADRYKVPFLGEIPLDPDLREGGDRGTPIVASNPQSPVAEAFMRVASAVAAQVSVITMAGAEKREGLFKILKVLQ